MRLVIAVVMAALLGGVSPASAEPIDNPAYHAWKDFKVGSRARVVGSTKTMGMETTLEMSTRLLEVTPEKVTIEVTTSITMNGNRVEQPAQKQDIPARVARDSVPSLVGEERITVNEKSYNCKVYAVQKTQDNTTIVAKTWMSSDVPGGVVRIESSTTGSVVSDSRFELKDSSTG